MYLYAHEGGEDRGGHILSTTRLNAVHIPTANIPWKRTE